MYEPIGTRIIVLPDVVKDVTDGGLIIPAMALEKPLEGVVLFVGPDVKQTKCADRVLYTRFTGSEVGMSSYDRPVLIMREEDVLALLRQERETLP